jgi:hypothetical protein
MGRICQGKSGDESVFGNPGRRLRVLVLVKYGGASCFWAFYLSSLEI